MLCLSKFLSSTCYKDRRIIRGVKLNKMAMVTIGPKTIKLTFANVEQDKCFYVYDELVEYLDLALDLPEGGMIRAVASAEIIKILKMYKRICEKQGIENVYAFISSFVAKAKNQVSFIDELESASGLRFKLLTVEDEMNATYMGIINSIDVPRGIIIDIQEESTNLIKYFRKSIVANISIPIGASSLSKLFTSNDYTPKEIHEQMVDFFKTQLDDYGIDEEFVAGCKYICVGKMAQGLFKMCVKVKKYPLDMQHNYVVDNNTYPDVYKIIETLEVDASKKIKGISNESADIFAGGMSIYKAIFDLQEEFEAMISTYGVEEGLLFSLAMPSTVEKPVADILQMCLDSLLIQYDSSRKNGQKVSDLAVLIFKQLKVLHKLPRTYLKSLKIAATLYRSGEAINYRNLYKNNFNVILSNPIFGASHKEQLLAAFIAQNVNNEAFNLAEWVKYKDILNEDDLDAMKKLSAILNIAIGLDITENGEINDLSCDVLGDSVIMKTSSETDVDFEIKYALHASKNFKRAFGKYLEIL